MIEVTEDTRKAVAFIEVIKDKYRELRELMPEDLLPLGVSAGSEEHLRFITLVVSIDYMKNADSLWRGGREAFAQSQWLFDPNEVSSLPEQRIAEALAGYHMTRMPNKDGHIWKSICTTLEQSWAGSVGALLKETDYDAEKLYWRVKADNNRFPYLSGPKILPLWIRMLNEEAGMGLSNMDKVPLPVDINVLRATFMLGVLKGRVAGDGSVIEELKNRCQKVWQNASHESSFPLIRLDEPLWLLGREDSRLGGLPRLVLIDDYRKRVVLGYDKVNIDTSPI